jgi:multimeric flavodoxin WrbA
VIKILGISGSPRKAATHYITQEALKAAERVGDVETKFISLHGQKTNFCIHCDRCMKEGVLYCPVYKGDIMDEIYPAFIEADAYIFASPVYQMTTSAQLQACFNRLRPLWPLIKDGMLKNKVGGSIAVGGKRHGGQETTLATINNFYLCFSIISVSAGYQAYNGASVWSQDKKAVGAAEDVVGMETVRALAERVVETAKMLKENNN